MSPRTAHLAAALALGLAIAPIAPAAAQPRGAPASPLPSAEIAERVRKGVAVVELGGRPVGVGTVLANDGRVLTALSALGASEQAVVRYADGSTSPVRVGHQDADWDLALLVPQGARSADGLSASDVDPASTDLRLVLPIRGRLGPSLAALRSRVDGRSRGGAPLLNLLDLDLKGALPVAGAPVLDAQGSAVGVLVRACRAEKAPPQGACQPAWVAAPVSAIRSFLMRTPATAVAPAPWLGLRGAPAAAGAMRGVRVLDVAPGSPAEKGGLRGGPDPARADVIVAVDGAPVDSPELLAAAVSKRAVGDTVKLLVFDGARFREAPVVLVAAPQAAAPASQPAPKR